MRALLVMLAAGGCYDPSPPGGAPCANNEACPSGLQCIAGVCGRSEPAVDASTQDTTIVDAASICSTWKARHFDPCMLPAPLGDLNLASALSGYSWDTSKPELKGKMNTVIPVTTMVMTQQNGPEVLVASVNNFTMDGGTTLDLNGSRALLIAVWGVATIAGSIEVDAALGAPGPGGAGTTAALGCGADPTGNFGAAGTPATGGGGGAFQGAGGRGGDNGGLGGTVIPAPTAIQGGCAGGGGGAGTGASGTRGAGGGAIQITARLWIAITASGVIHAGGGGGTGGRAARGAGGAGGAGGYIGLDAPNVGIAGALAANGGGGGGGASDTANGGNGSTGGANALPALGGPGGSPSTVGTCGRGGNGAAGGTLAGENGGNSGCGGGGGGGGAGYILLWSPSPIVSGTVSPPLTSGP